MLAARVPWGERRKNEIPGAPCVHLQHRQEETKPEVLVKPGRFSEEKIRKEKVLDSRLSAGESALKELWSSVSNFHPQ